MAGATITSPVAVQTYTRLKGRALGDNGLQLDGAVLWPLPTGCSFGVRMTGMPGFSSKCRNCKFDRPAKKPAGSVVISLLRKFRLTKLVRPLNTPAGRAANSLSAKPRISKFDGPSNTAVRRVAGRLFCKARRPRSWSVGLNTPEGMLESAQSETLRNSRSRRAREKVGRQRRQAVQSKNLQDIQPMAKTRGGAA